MIQNATPAQTQKHNDGQACSQGQEPAVQGKCKGDISQQHSDERDAENQGRQSQRGGCELARIVLLTQPAEGVDCTDANRQRERHFQDGLKRGAEDILSAERAKKIQDKNAERQHPVYPTQGTAFIWIALQNTFPSKNREAGADDKAADRQAFSQNGGDRTAIGIQYGSTPDQPGQPSEQCAKDAIECDGDDAAGERVFYASLRRGTEFGASAL